MPTMPWIAIVILLSAVEFMVLGAMVGRARAKYGVKAPATSGHEVFDVQLPMPRRT